MAMKSNGRKRKGTKKNEKKPRAFKSCNDMRRNRFGSKKS